MDLGAGWDSSWDITSQQACPWPGHHISEEEGPVLPSLNPFEADMAYRAPVDWTR